MNNLNRYWKSNNQVVQNIRGGLLPFVPNRNYIRHLGPHGSTPMAYYPFIPMPATLLCVSC